MKDEFVFAFNKDDNFFENGLFDNQAEIIRMVKKEFPDVKMIYIGTTTETNLKWENVSDYVVNSIYNNIVDECGFSADAFGLTNDMIEDLDAMLNKEIEFWIKKHNLHTNAKKIINIKECIL